MHCTYEQVLNTPMPIVQCYLELMAAEADVDKKDRKTRRK